MIRDSSSCLARLRLRELRCGAAPAPQASPLTSSPSCLRSLAARATWLTGASRWRTLTSRSCALSRQALPLAELLPAHRLSLRAPAVQLYTGEWLRSYTPLDRRAAGDGYSAFGGVAVRRAAAALQEAKHPWTIGFRSGPL